jgi:hypothetical protein
MKKKLKERNREENIFITFFSIGLSANREQVKINPGKSWINVLKSPSVNGEKRKKTETQVPSVMISLCTDIFKSVTKEIAFKYSSYSKRSSYKMGIRRWLPHEDFPSTAVFYTVRKRLAIFPSPARSH